MKRFLFGFYIVLFFLTSCASNPKQEQSQEPNLETDFQAVYFDHTIIAHPIVEVKDGYYIIAGYYIYYVDKATMTYTPLCNKPNCLHQKETDPTKVTNCNAMVRVNVGMNTSLNYYKGNLYIATIEIIKDENSIPENKYAMTKLSLDGEKREIVHEFEKPVQTAIVHRGYIYYSSAASLLGSEPAGVYRIPINGGEEETLYISENRNNYVSNLKVIDNVLVFSEYGDEDFLFRYDLNNEQLEPVVLEGGIKAGRSVIANDRIYYAATDPKDASKWYIISTKLDGTDEQREDFLAHHFDDDYYYFEDLTSGKQTVYDWEDNHIVAEFSQIEGITSVFPAKEKLFWYVSLGGTIKISYINREDIPKGDSAVHVLMELSDEETYPAIVTTPN